ncbi:DEK isoform X2 [Brachionus plicatilis]|uniref:DEK isoform X2 n=1 Tax=Brachionus plicatilis TaxID=10195 RepID=A0A3M7T2N8_BRAPC|nr:DEK isoform X2 [Brachionus plicatilis]
MSENTEKKAESQTSEVTAPIVEEPEKQAATEPKTEEVKSDEPEAKVEQVKEHIEVVPSDAPINVTQKIQHAEHSEKRQEAGDAESATQESKSKESTVEVTVNDQSLKVETKSEQTTSEEKTEDKVVTKRTTRGRVSRTAKAGDAVSTESVEVVEEKKPVEQKVEEQQATPEGVEVETPKRGRGRQPKRKASTPPEKKETKKTKVESPLKKDETEHELKEDDEANKDVPLLEQSLTVEGKRHRRTTQRLELNAKESSSKHSYTPQGKGKALGDIALICHNIDKTTADKMRQLYRLCMGYNPKHKETKKNLKAFNGFEFAADSDEMDKKRDLLQKSTVGKLKEMCDVVDLERSGNKEVLIARLLDFLAAPVDSGRPVPAPRPRGRARGRPKSKTPSKKAENGDDMDVDASLSDQEPDESGSEADESKEEPEKDKEEVNGKEKDTQADQPPNEDELKKTIKEIIDSANLDKVTMKKVIQDVYARYPEHNLNDQKSVIKKIVKELLEVQ